jgi:hypothetical protein
MKQHPLQQEKEELMQSPHKQQMQQVHQPLQQKEPRKSPLQKGNQDRKPLSKDEILNCVNGTPILSEANIKAAGPNCAKLHVMSWNTVRINLPFQQRWIKTTLKVVVVL